MTTTTRNRSRFTRTALTAVLTGALVMPIAGFATAGAAFALDTPGIPGSNEAREVYAAQMATLEASPYGPTKPACIKAKKNAKVTLARLSKPMSSPTLAGARRIMAERTRAYKAAQKRVPVVCTAPVKVNPPFPAETEAGLDNDGYWRRYIAERWNGYTNAVENTQVVGSCDVRIPVFQINRNATTGVYGLGAMLINYGPSGVSVRVSVEVVRPDGSLVTAIPGQPFADEEMFVPNGVRFLGYVDVVGKNAPNWDQILPGDEWNTLKIAKVTIECLEHGDNQVPGVG